MPIDIDEATRGYLVAALWADAPEEWGLGGSGPFNESHADRFTRQAKADARRLVAKFVTDAGDDLADYPSANVGHDLWLTRNGHGCGFWEADHCSEDAGRRLTELAHKLGEASVYRTGRYFGIE